MAYDEMYPKIRTWVHAEQRARDAERRADDAEQRARRLFVKLSETRDRVERAEHAMDVANQRAEEAEQQLSETRSKLHEWWGRAERAEHDLAEAEKRAEEAEQKVDGFVRKDRDLWRDRAQRAEHRTAKAENQVEIEKQAKIRAERRADHAEQAKPSWSKTEAALRAELDVANQRAKDAENAMDAFRGDCDYWRCKYVEMEQQFADADLKVKLMSDKAEVFEQRATRAGNRAEIAELRAESAEQALYETAGGSKTAKYCDDCGEAVGTVFVNHDGRRRCSSCVLKRAVSSAAQRASERYGDGNADQAEESKLCGDCHVKDAVFTFRDGRRRCTSCLFKAAGSSMGGSMALSAREIREREIRERQREGAGQRIVTGDGEVTLISNLWQQLSVGTRDDPEMRRRVVGWLFDRVEAETDD